MCQYNNIVMKTLSLQIQSELSQQTLQAIFQEYGPTKVGLKESVIYVQFDDQNRYNEFAKNVKSGAFPQLKSETFQILDQPSNIQACLQKCLTVLTSANQIQMHFVKSKSQLSLKKQGMSQVSESTNFAAQKQKVEQQDKIGDETNNEYENTILFNPIYEASEVIRVDFDEYPDPVGEEITIQAEILPRQQEDKINQNIMMDQPSSFQKVQEERKEPTIEQDRSVVQKQSETVQKDVNTVDNRAATSNAFYFLLLSLWITYWIIS